MKKDKEYQLVDRDGQVVEKLTGQNLQKQHYDSVDVNVRHRALQEQRRGRSEKKQKEGWDPGSKVKNTEKVGTRSPKVVNTDNVKGPSRRR